MWLYRLEIKKVTPESRKKQNDHLVYESSYELYINNTLAIVFSCLPKLEENLVRGYLRMHGYHYENLREGDIHIQNDTINVHTTLESTIQTPVFSKNLAISSSSIFKLTATFQENALLFKKTAVTESAATIYNEKITSFAEDIHLDNAIYKVLGDPLSKTCNGIILSGKLTLGILKKLHKCGTYYIILRTAPSYNAYQYALEHNIIIIGFSRGLRYNIYTYPNRIHNY